MSTDNPRFAPTWLVSRDGLTQCPSCTQHFELSAAVRTHHAAACCPFCEATLTVQAVRHATRRHRPPPRTALGLRGACVAAALALVPLVAGCSAAAGHADPLPQTQHQQQTQTQPSDEPPPPDPVVDPAEPAPGGQIAWLQAECRIPNTAEYGMPPLPDPVLPAKPGVTTVVEIRDEPDGRYAMIELPWDADIERGAAFAGFERRLSLIVVDHAYSGRQTQLYRIKLEPEEHGSVGVGTTVRFARC